MKKVVLLDFHNTLATCDGWLELEITTLPGLVLERLASDGLVERSAADQKDRATALFKALRQRVRESGVEISAVEGARQVLVEMGFAVPDAAIEAAVADLEHALLPQVEMIPGADAALSKLRDRGYRMGVVSSAGYPLFVEMALEKLGLRTYFSEVVTSAGEGIYKSDPEIFRRAASKLGVRSEEAVHVGDHAIYDVQTAKAAGLAAVWFAGQARRTAQLHGTKWEDAAQAGSLADATIEKMEELFDAITSL